MFKLPDDPTPPSPPATIERAVDVAPPAEPPVAEITVIGAAPKEEVPPAPPTVNGCGPGIDGAGYVRMALPPPPPPPPPAGEPVEVPPAPPPPTTVTLIDLTVAGFVHVLEPVYAFITTLPVAPADACVVLSGNTTPDAPILVVAMLAP